MSISISMMRRLTWAWFACWLLFGLPWIGFSPYAHWGRVSWRPFPPRHVWRDDALNFAFYVPFGVFTSGFGWTNLTVVASATALSTGTELSQVFSRNRYPSTTDVVTNTLGALSGAVILKLLRGRSTVP